MDERERGPDLIGHWPDPRFYSECNRESLEGSRRGIHSLTSVSVGSLWAAVLAVACRGSLEIERPERGLLQKFKRDGMVILDQGSSHESEGRNRGCWV